MNRLLYFAFQRSDNLTRATIKVSNTLELSRGIAYAVFYVEMMDYLYGGYRFSYLLRKYKGQKHPSTNDLQEQTTFLVYQFSSAPQFSLMIT